MFLSMQSFDFAKFNQIYPINLITFALILPKFHLNFAHITNLINFRFCPKNFCLGM